MIRYIKGEYLYYDSGAIVVETSGGIGFRINVSDTSSLLTAREGDIIEVYTYLQVKEDGMSLYGFSDSEGLKLFEMLISVNGVGPKAGLAIMSLGTPNQIKAIIAAKDAASVSMAQGVGKKTAERVILELNDKVSVLPIDEEPAGVIGTRPDSSAERTEAVTALTTLGYSKREAEQAVGAVTEDNLKTEEYVRKALKYLL
ncbi:MAG: Holliday junction branch migration protein RuvA [Clostridiales bacterium]|nr:Holliday junction branch migration protein RuvA [Candidatus Crickella caballi]